MHWGREGGLSFLGVGNRTVFDNMNVRAEWVGDPRERQRFEVGLEGTESGAKLYLDNFLLVPRVETVSL